MPNKTFVPPGGFAGFAQQTPAVQSLLRKKRPARKKAKKKTAKRRAVGVGARGKKPVVRRAAPKKAAGKRLVKGSPAAKRRMAQLRRMRKS